MKKIILMILLLSLSACSFNREVENGVSIKHASGESEVILNPENIVIFDLGILDSFDYLGIDIVGLPKANLSDRLSKYNSDDYFNAGTLFEPDFEKIAEMEVDLIIISGRSASNYDELSKIAPTINLEIDNNNYLDSVYSNLNIIKTLFPDKKEKIDNEIASIKVMVDELKESAANLNEQTLFLLANGDSISVYGPTSRYGMVYSDFGFSPISGIEYDDSSHGQQVSFEFVREHNPDSIIVMDRIVATGSEGVLGNHLLDNALINSTSAKLNDRIIFLDPFAWYIETGGITATKKMIKDLSLLIN